jgi:ABC-2 type transport system permease protein
MNETRPLHWSIRRELWENRSIYIAPLIVTAVVLFATLVSTIGLPKRIRNAASLSEEKQRAVLVRPFDIAPAPIMLASFVVGLFYSIDALYGERRDRSILFWKSLPVSDQTAVLAKALIPIAVLPAIAYLLSVITQIILLSASSMMLLAHRMSPVPLWAEFRFFRGLLIMAYGLAVHALWFAPIYGWLLLLSAWAKRAVILWAVLPPFAIGVAERMMFGSSSLGRMLQYRVTGAMKEAFTFKSGGNIDRLSQLDPIKFLAAPGLWVGLIFAAACFLAAVRLRRNREPI